MYVRADIMRMRIIKFNVPPHPEQSFFLGQVQLSQLMLVFFVLQHEFLACQVACLPETPLELARK
jgi:hypothetical protein